MKWRSIIFGVIIIICIVSINYGIYWMVTEEEPKKTTTSEAVIDTETILNQFSSIFDNSIDYQGYTVDGKLKKDNTRELVYTSKQVKEKIDGKYEINVNIPFVNISKSIVDDINEQIEQVFYSKVASLTSDSNNTLNQLDVQNKKINTTIYNVQYKAYVNSNILSLVIKATLKEGVNEQRIMVKTYNYNLTTHEEIKLDQLKEIKGIDEQLITQEIQRTIKQANQQAQNLENLGYSVLYREPTDDIYNIKLSNESINCFLGKNGMLYIVYPYGNRENTSEMDIILFQ